MDIGLWGVGMVCEKVVDGGYMGEVSTLDEWTRVVSVWGIGLGGATVVSDWSELAGWLEAGGL